VTLVKLTVMSPDVAVVNVNVTAPFGVSGDEKTSVVLAGVFVVVEFDGVVDVELQVHVLNATTASTTS